MSENTNFDFIRDKILRQNLDTVFNHILTLVPFTKSNNYDDEAKSSFRKSIIISTASIVEALLFYILDKNFKDSDISEFYSNWEIKNKQVLYTVKKGEYEIIAGEYKKIQSKTTKEKMNIGQIANFLKAKNIIDKKIFDKIDKLRILRNEQHIGTHKIIKIYSEKQLESAFSIASNIKEFTKDFLEKK